MVRLYCFILVLLSPISSFAAFDSQQSLFKAFASSGYDTIIEFPAGDFSSGPKMKVHAIDSNGRKMTQPIEDFAKGESKRMSALDYIYNPEALLARDKAVEAYQVADVFLCYYLSGRIYTCYMFPVNISKVIQDLKIANVIK